ncbi:hypothetical protein B0I35DRAFT_424872 [Stachybotrys elegans]|uniref:Uncharacterized protein n=1 Tax=Stachybotrys elegans TaxID=80388 RepID=A0A8K0T319_9HYPO|nr:hypothetical protein B0I35DRAFT_424872 [Stachybotrys elegans]
MSKVEPSSLVSRARQDRDGLARLGKEPRGLAASLSHRAHPPLHRGPHRLSPISHGRRESCQVCMHMESSQAQRGDGSCICSALLRKQLRYHPIDWLLRFNSGCSGPLRALPRTSMAKTGIYDLCAPCSTQPGFVFQVHNRVH